MLKECRKYNHFVGSQLGSVGTFYIIHLVYTTTFLSVIFAFRSVEALRQVSFSSTT